ncbi:MAG: gene transfer agent family protein [Hyphomicrobiaceae bacterium]
MPNPHRGEIEAVIDGRPMTLCLTLGALAELENTFGAEDMLALANRLATGRLAARDTIRVVAAGLRGAGHDVRDTDVDHMRMDNGVAGFVDTVTRLLAATFGTSETATAEAPSSPSMAKGEVDPAPAPFPGTM